MPDQEQSGPSRATVALIVVLALPVVLVVMFLLVGRVRAGQDSALPQLETKGLKWAQARANTAGFESVKSHDALGRDRGQRDTKSWMVCFMEPGPGNHARSTTVEFGVVQLDETCPKNDEGRIDRAGVAMPPIVGRTAYMARVAFGDDASIRFVDVASERGVDHDLGNYVICTQDPLPGQPWDGVPVKAAVVPYGDDCDHPRGTDPRTFDPREVLDRVLKGIS